MLRRNPLPKTIKLEGNPLHEEPVLQLRWKVKDNLAILWKIWMWTWLFWGQSMTATLQAAVPLGKDYDMNLFCKELSLENNGTAFQGDRKAGQCQTENAGRSLINFQDLRWMSTSLLHSRACQYTTAKVCVFFDSVLCLGEMGDDPVESWKSKIHWYSDNNYFKDLNRIDGQPTEFEWKIFPGLATVGIFNQIQQMMRELQCEPENFTGRILFMSMFNDTVWDVKGNGEICEKQFKDNKRVCSKIPSR